MKPTAALLRPFHRLLGFFFLFFWMGVLAISSFASSGVFLGEKVLTSH